MMNYHVLHLRNSERRRYCDGPILSLLDCFGWNSGRRDDDYHNKFVKEAFEDTSDDDPATLFAINFVYE